MKLVVSHLISVICMLAFIALGLATTVAFWGTLVVSTLALFKVLTPVWLLWVLVSYTGLMVVSCLTVPLQKYLWGYIFEVLASLAASLPGKEAVGACKKAMVGVLLHKVCIEHGLYTVGWRGQVIIQRDRLTKEHLSKEAE